MPVPRSFRIGFGSALVGYHVGSCRFHLRFILMSCLFHFKVMSVSRQLHVGFTCSVSVSLLFHVTFMPVLFPFHIPDSCRCSVFCRLIFRFISVSFRIHVCCFFDRATVSFLDYFVFVSVSYQFHTSLKSISSYFHVGFGCRFHFASVVGRCHEGFASKSVSFRFRVTFISVSRHFSRPFHFCFTSVPCDFHFGLIWVPRNFQPHVISDSCHVHVGLVSVLYRWHVGLMYRFHDGFISVSRRIRFSCTSVSVGVTLVSRQLEISLLGFHVGFSSMQICRRSTKYDVMR